MTNFPFLLEEKTGAPDASYYNIKFILVERRHDLYYVKCCLSQKLDPTKKIKLHT